MLAGIQRPPLPASRITSESSRNRLHARSIASSSCSRTSIAPDSAAASRVVTSAVVPRAGKVAVAGFMGTIVRRAHEPTVKAACESAVRYSKVGRRKPDSRAVSSASE